MDYPKQAQAIYKRSSVFPFPNRAYWLVPNEAYYPRDGRGGVVLADNKHVLDLETGKITEA